MAKAARTPNPALLGGDAMSAEETGQMEAARNDAPPAPEPEAEAPAPEQEAPQVLEADHEDHDEPTIDPKTGQSRKVDIGALHEERKRRKEAVAEAAKAREEAAKLMGRFETIQQLMQRNQPQQQKPQAEAPIEIPDINLDPVGHFAAKDAIRERELADLRSWKQMQDQQSEVRTNAERLTQIAQSHEAVFSKTTPDYPEAFQYLRAQRDAELQAMGYLDPNARSQAIMNDALAIAAQALQRNVNAAEVVYNMAKARGYQGKAPAPAAVAPTPAPAVQSPDAKKLATIAKGQAASQSLGQVNGAAVPDISPEAIVKMSDAEFEKWATDDNWRKMMGG